MGHRNVGDSTPVWRARELGAQPLSQTARSHRRCKPHCTGLESLSVGFTVAAKGLSWTQFGMHGKIRC
jgi:hypothetical protein